MYNWRKKLFQGETDVSHLRGIDCIHGRKCHQRSSCSSDLCYSLPSSGTLEKDDDGIYFPSYGENKPAGKVGRENQVKSMDYFPEDPPAMRIVAYSGMTERPADDTAARVQPSRHVDYFSHNWIEEDIWSSWKHLVLKKDNYANSERLLNALWRIWEKKRKNLKTIPPGNVKWLKEHDVTWLYGPLQPGLSAPRGNENSHNSCQVSKSVSDCASKKPILKKRSLSELMLRRSFPSASLPKESAATSDSKLITKLDPTSADPVALRLSTASSNAIPRTGNSNWSSRSVRFHGLVEQCIPLAYVGDDNREHHYVGESNDEVVVMRKSLKAKRETRQWLPLSDSNKKPVVSKTIERLPHAILKSGIESESKNPVMAPRAALGISHNSAQEWSSLQSTSLLSGESSTFDNDEKDRCPPPAWLHHRRDSVKMPLDKLKDVRMQSSLEDLSQDLSFSYASSFEEEKENVTNVPHLTEGPITGGRKICSTSEPLPSRPQLASSFIRDITQASYPSSPDAIIDPVASNEESRFAGIEASSSNPDKLCSCSDVDSENSEISDPVSAVIDEVMVEFWNIFNEKGSPLGWELSPTKKRVLTKLVRSDVKSLIQSQQEPNASSIISQLESLIHDCHEKVLAEYQETADGFAMDGFPDSMFEMPLRKAQGLNQSPSTSSDSGYGSEEAWRVRDESQSHVEKEKGISDWDLYADTWDEMDEAIAWQRGF